MKEDQIGGQESNCMGIKLRSTAPIAIDNDYFFGGGGGRGKDAWMNSRNCAMKRKPGGTIFQVCMDVLLAMTFVVIVTTQVLLCVRGFLNGFVFQLNIAL